VTWSNTADPASLGRLLDAVMAIASDLDLAQTLRRIVEAATELVDARYGALGVLDPSGSSLAEFVTVGVDDDTYRAIGEPPKGHGLLGLLITDPRPIRLPDLRDHPASYGFPPGHPQMRSFLGVPITLRGDVLGNLYLTDKQSAEAFTEVDEELTVALAVAAGAAISNARVHALTRSVSRLEERERIAADLHDTVIRQLFATGLSLQGVEPMVEHPEASRRVQLAVDDLDNTIRQIRSTVFELGPSLQVPVASNGEHVLAMVTESARLLGLQPHLEVHGPADATFSDAEAGEVVAILRDLIARVAERPGATQVNVVLTALHDEILLRVAEDDDGAPIEARIPRQA
jgi:signal transduction histidine kinase